MKIFFASFLILTLWATDSLADELLFFHSPGCFYCKMWRDDNADIYHKTTEGKRLPLREINLDRGLPDDLKHLTYPSFTPTFVVVDENRKEVGRIVGYNEEFFWGFLEAYIRKLDNK